MEKDGGTDRKQIQVPIETHTKVREFAELLAATYQLRNVSLIDAIEKAIDVAREQVESNHGIRIKNKNQSSDNAGDGVTAYNHTLREWVSGLPYIAALWIYFIVYIWIFIIKMYRNPQLMLYWGGYRMGIIAGMVGEVYEIWNLELYRESKYLEGLL